MQDNSSAHLNKYSISMHLSFDFIIIKQQLLKIGSSKLNEHQGISQ